VKTLFFARSPKAEGVGFDKLLGSIDSKSSISDIISHASAGCVYSASLAEKMSAGAKRMDGAR
jgi:hypothetical protein